MYVHGDYFSKRGLMCNFTHVLTTESLDNPLALNWTQSQNFLITKTSLLSAGC